VVPTLARLAFAAAVADAQRALDDRRDELAELARARMERAMREAAETRATQAARERARASETGTGTGTGTGTETEAGEPGRGSGDAGG